MASAPRTVTVRSAASVQSVTAYIDRLIARLRPHALDLVDSFGYSQEHLRAPIASGIEKERQDEAREYYRTLRASGTAPVDEKKLTKAHTKKSPGSE